MESWIITSKSQCGGGRALTNEPRKPRGALASWKLWQWLHMYSNEHPRVQSTFHGHSQIISTWEISRNNGSELWEPLLPRLLGYIKKISTLRRISASHQYKLVNDLGKPWRVWQGLMNEIFRGWSHQGPPFLLAAFRLIWSLQVVILGDSIPQSKIILRAQRKITVFFVCLCCGLESRYLYVGIMGLPSGVWWTSFSDRIATFSVSNICSLGLVATGTRLTVSIFQMWDIHRCLGK